jgi:hypothetical protein
MGQFLAKLIRDPVRIRPGPVTFIDESQSRNPVTIHLTINGNGLGLDSANGTKNQDRSVQYTKGALNLNREIHMPGGINNIDVMSLPDTMGSGRRDRNASLFFQLHGIHLGTDTILTPDLMNGKYSFGVVQDPFGQGSLAGIDMSADADVPYFLNIFQVLFS